MIAFKKNNVLPHPYSSRLATLSVVSIILAYGLNISKLII